MHSLIIKSKTFIACRWVCVCVLLLSRPKIVIDSIESLDIFTMLLNMNSCMSQLVIIRPYKSVANKLFGSVAFCCCCIFATALQMNRQMNLRLWRVRGIKKDRNKKEFNQMNKFTDYAGMIAQRFAGERTSFQSCCVLRLFFRKPTCIKEKWKKEKESVSIICT